MKKISLLICVLSTLHLYAQVPKKIIVEHFTNTKCGVCANKNPGFYTNLNKQPGVLHLAIHPSSPYSACVLSQHNVAENDGRTNYYDVYGSTPRLVIQGVVIASNASYDVPSLFTPYLGKTSPASIRIEQTKFGKDSIRSKIIIKTEATHTLGGLSLFVALAEDTLKYTGSNGEPVHYDVFRKSLTGITGVNITLPATPGDSVTYVKSSASNAAWNFSRIYTLVILQEKTSKAVIQCQSVPANSKNITTGINDVVHSEPVINVFSTSEGILVKQDHFSEHLLISVYDLSGRIILTEELEKDQELINLPSAGIYTYTLTSKELLLKSGKVSVP